MHRLGLCAMAETVSVRLAEPVGCAQQSPVGITGPLVARVLLVFAGRAAEQLRVGLQLAAVHGMRNNPRVAGLQLVMDLLLWRR